MINIALADDHKMFAKELWAFGRREILILLESFQTVRNYWIF